MRAFEQFGRFGEGGSDCTDYRTILLLYRYTCIGLLFFIDYHVILGRPRFGYGRELEWRDR